MVSESLRTFLLGESTVTLEALSNSQILASQLTDIFIVIVLATFLISIYLRSKEKYSEFTLYTPSLLTSLGILGTFTGIVVGLVAFDTKNIDGSIENLLWGMQTAFITSIWGIFLSIAYKAYISLTTFDSSDEVGMASGVADTAVLIAKQTEFLEKISKSISDENSDASIVNVMKLSRADTNDYRKSVLAEISKLSAIEASIEALHDLLSKQLNKQESLTQMLELQVGNFKSFEDRLWRNLQEFADMMSKSATEQVIEALKQVISDFNNNLTEQFGENFKALNQAVLELVTWQDNYKTQLLEMSNQYSEGVKAISLTEQSVAHISQESAVIPQTMGELKTVIEVNQHQLSELERHLEAFKTIRDKAVEAVPEIEARIDQTIKGVEQATTNLSTGLEESALKLSGAIIKTADEFDNSVTRVNGSLQTTSDHVSEKSEEIKDLLLDSVKQIRTDFIDLFDDVQAQNAKVVSSHENSVVEIEENYKKIASNLQSNFDAVTSDLSGKLEGLNESFHQNINKSLNSNDETSKKLIKQHENLVSDFSSNIQRLQSEIQSNVTNLINDISQNIEASVQEQVAQTGSIRKTLQTFAEDTMRDSAEVVQNQTRMIDTALEKEINKSMSDLGSALSSITQKFTKDYSNLVNEMNKVVQNR